MLRHLRKHVAEGGGTGAAQPQPQPPPQGHHQNPAVAGHGVVVPTTHHLQHHAPPPPLQPHPTHTAVVVPTPNGVLATY